VGLSCLHSSQQYKKSGSRESEAIIMLCSKPPKLEIDRARPFVWYKASGCGQHALDLIIVSNMTV
jgi:hypothetical protein